MKIATYGVLLLAFLIAALFIAHDLRGAGAGNRSVSSVWTTTTC